MELHDHPQRDERVVWHRGGEGVVILNPNDGQYFSLDEVAARIWELCEGDRSVAEIADVVAAEYEVEPAVVSADALEFLEELTGEGLVVAG
jgi:pyrroloquinoline quinone biosynthesis protein D